MCLSSITFIPVGIQNVNISYIFYICLLSLSGGKCTKFFGSFRFLVYSVECQKLLTQSTEKGFLLITAIEAEQVIYCFSSAKLYLLSSE